MLESSFTLAGKWCVESICPRPARAGREWSCTQVLSAGLGEGITEELGMKDQISQARQLRHEQTRSEARAWWLLRNRRLAGFKFRRQHRIGPFFADFCCPELKLIVELEGSVHSQPSVIKADARRDEYLKSEGYSVFHFPNGMVLKAPEEFIGKVKCLCEELRTKSGEKRG
jgi:very-short-patch-repair endonuclease